MFSSVLRPQLQTGARVLLRGFRCSAHMLSEANQAPARSPQVTILDGGMGHLLRRKGVEIKGVLGSQERFLGIGLANRDNPTLVTEAHQDYINAGASVVTTNSYSCVPACLSLSGGYAEENLSAFITSAGLLAVHAAKAAPAGREVLVAGCLPPLGPSYRADLVPSDEVMQRDYAYIAAHIAPHSSLLLCETMSSIREAVAATQAAVEQGLPVWVAVTLADSADGTLRSGETIEDAAVALTRVVATTGNKSGGTLAAVLLNCSSPEAVTVAMPRLRAALPATIAIGGYANGFVAKEGKQMDAYNEDLSPEAYADIAEGWVSNGATLVGGCCGCFPEHIAALHARFGTSA